MWNCFYQIYFSFRVLFLDDVTTTLPVKSRLQFLTDRRQFGFFSFNYVCIFYLKHFYLFKFNLSFCVQVFADLKVSVSQVRQTGLQIVLYFFPFVFLYLLMFPAKKTIIEYLSYSLYEVIFQVRLYWHKLFINQLFFNCFSSIIYQVCCQDATALVW